jgi:hypothetical protein
MPTTRVLIEIELQKQILCYALSFIYSFPYTQMTLVRLFSELNDFEIYGLNGPLPPTINISNYINVGSVNLTIGDDEFLASTFPLQLNNQSSKEGGARLITFLNKS